MSEPRRLASLGPLVQEWIENNCVIPDGEAMGQPFRLTNEMGRFVQWFYAIDLDTRRWVYERGGQLIRPQKWGKGPFSAALICAEAAGPVVPKWDGLELVGGRSWETPWIQVTAVSEDQTANVFRALLPMIQLSPHLNMEIADTGLTRVNLPGGGFIEPVTASARSRLGQRITFAVQDETHSWVQTNGGLQLADNQRRNLAGMSGRFVETTNAFDPVEGSVAQRTFESKAGGVLVDDADPPPGSVRNKRERRKVLRAVYGDSHWVDLDRIDVEIDALLEHDPAQAERFFLNRKLAMTGAAFDIEAWNDQTSPRTIPEFSTIVIGVDGARHDDALAVVACDVKSGYLWPLDIQERPDDAGDDYEHDKDRVDGVVRDAFARFNVWRLNADPHYLTDLIAGWSNEFGDKRISEWYTNRNGPIAWAVRDFEQAIARGETPHQGDEVFTAHVANARKRMLTVLDDKQRPMHTLSKPAQRSRLKIDAAMAAVLAWHGRWQAIETGVYVGDAQPEKPQAPVERWKPGQAIDPRVLSGSLASDAPMGEFS